MIVSVNDRSIKMELDTGSPWSIVSSKTYSQFGKASDIRTSNVNLKTYTGAKVKILGETEVKVKYASTEPVALPLLVEEEGTSLMGRQWIERIPVPLDKILHCHAVSETNDVPASQTLQELERILQSQ